MKICVVKNCKLELFLQQILPSLKQIDLVLFSSSVVPQISYEKEISGEEHFISTIVKISEQLQCIVLLASKFDLFSKLNSAMLIVEKGVLLGIADCVLEKEKRVKELKLYQTDMGQIGILINQDIFSRVIVERFVAFGAKTLIHISCLEEKNDIKQQLVFLQKKYDISIISYQSNCLYFLEKNKQKIIPLEEDCLTKEIKI